MLCLLVPVRDLTHTNSYLYRGTLNQVPPLITHTKKHLEPFKAYLRIWPSLLRYLKYVGNKYFISSWCVCGIVSLNIWTTFCLGIPPASAKLLQLCLISCCMLSKYCCLKFFPNFYLLLISHGFFYSSIYLKHWNLYLWTRPCICQYLKYFKNYWSSVETNKVHVSFRSEVF